MCEFWEKTKYGYLHRANRASDRYVPELGCIFVHGINSGPRMWLNLVPKRFRQAGIDADAFVYDYPAGFFQSTSNEKAASHLAEAIKNQFPVIDESGEYDPPRHIRNIVIFAHSNGGLVVKLMMNADARAMLEQELDRKVLLYDLDSITLRTRTIMNFDVPHSGAHPLLSRFLLIPYTGLNLLFGWLEATRFISKRPLGINWIAWFLRNTNGQLSAIEREYWDLAARVRDRDLPFPHAEDIVAASSSVIADPTPRPSDTPSSSETGKVRKVVQTDREHIRTRSARAFLGSHGSVLDGDSNDDLTVKEQKSHLRRFVPSPNVIFCERIVLLQRKVNAERGVRELVGEGVKNQQASVFETIRDSVQNTPTQKYHVVTGDALVGKSRTLAALGRSLAARYLSNADQRSQRLLPLIIQLKDVKIVPSDADAAKVRPDWMTNEAFRQVPLLFWTLINAWCRRLTDIFGQPDVFTPEWAYDQILRQSHVLIIDDLDDFLNCHPGVAWEDLRDMLIFLRRRAPSVEISQSVVLGVRSGVSWLRDLKDWRCHNIELMSEDHVIKRFPKLSPIFKACRNDPFGGLDEASRLLRTPMIAFTLGEHADGLLDPEELSLGKIFEAAIRAMAMETRIPRPQADESGDEYLSADDLMEIFTVVAICYYGPVEADRLGSEVVLTISQIQAAADKLERLWIREFGGDWSKHPLATGFALVRHPRILSAALTVICRALDDYFLSAQPQWSFVHQYVRDFLCGRYLARLGNDKFIDELARLGFMPHMHTFAGHLMGATEFDEPEIRKAREIAIADTNLYGIGNCLALFARNPKMTFSAGASRQMAEARANPQLLPWARCFLINGFFVKKMTEASRDLNGFFTDAREGKDVEFVQLLRGPVATSFENGDVITRSLTHAYLTLFSSDLSGNLPAVRLQDQLDEVRRVAAIGCNIDDPLKRRTLQLSNIQLVEILLARFPSNVPIRCVASVHYLLYLAATFADGYWITESKALLADVFDLDGRYRAIFAGVDGEKSFRRPQQVVDVFHAAERLYRGEG